MNPMAERAARQNIIDEKNFEPLWCRHVDIPMIEMCLGCGLPKTPVILMPELRFKTLLTNLTECLTATFKIMIVNNMNSQFELFRASVRKNVHNLYFSAQEISALNYADNIFDDVLTQLSLYSTTRAEVIFSGYRRVMKPGGHLICCMPKAGTFPAFFDFLDECLYAMNPSIERSIMEELQTALLPENCKKAIENAGLEVKGQENVSFDLSFPTAEQLLFSSFVESHYLGYCLNLMEPGLDMKQLLTRLVRSFHCYLQDEKPKIPVKCTIFTAQKPS